MQNILGMHLLTFVLHEELLASLPKVQWFDTCQHRLPAVVSHAALGARHWRLPLI